MKLRVEVRRTFPGLGLTMPGRDQKAHVIVDAENSHDAAEQAMKLYAAPKAQLTVGEINQGVDYDLTQRGDVGADGSVTLYTVPREDDENRPSMPNMPLRPAKKGKAA